MANLIQVYIYKDEGLIDTYKAFPPVVILHKEDDFQIVNTTDVEASWTPPYVFGFDPKDPPEKIPKKKKSKAWKLKKDDEILVIEYKVNVGTHHAHGNSDPRIIIDP